ncbi:acyl-ACP--UDP-N-acetylglucosamine O-acyltransferase [Actomonas aquatica]|uniref:Acyl-ACP--UDP-N-acetylglucosamine O-acyltransferase n=1 Tax=Actomonas aquatica TaxID=2866162 RepID=A0ABZ1CCK2_9BACT|nr:acyl-ACP--UDP-N-acetylglucosamine O-acyltransferase [Opitutus sp. WL0086]WRQ89223.1 acyl-ACP--UDP-N-acetylglucosamine O-acyltransferase [Opitutus sp. WL0086]
MGTLIHPGAHVDPAAQLGVDVEVMPGAVVTRWARLGDRVVVHPTAVIGGDPQYLGFKRETPTWVEVGADTVLREGVTLNRAIHEDAVTSIGARCFFMANSHAGHDAQVADDVILANGALLAGHVEVGAFSFIGGNAAVHQFCRIGPVAMIGGVSPITGDVPPYCMVADRSVVAGLNVVGLKRRGWPREVIRELKDAYRAVMRPTGNMRTVAAELLPDVSSEQARTFLEFFTTGGKRPIARPRRGRDDGGDDA